MKTKAFTLIELMAVITIIVILSGILIAGINDWKDEANYRKTIAYANEVKTKLAGSLIGEWKMDVEQGNFNYLYDSGRLGLKATTEGSVFDRSTDCVEGSACIEASQSIIKFPNFQKFKTICFWAKFDSIYTVDIMSKELDFNIYTFQGIPYFQIYNTSGTSQTFTFSDKKINDLKWHHVCGTINNSTFYGILDGDIIITQTSPVQELGWKTSTYLYVSPAGHDEFFFMDDLVVFEDSLF
ncbi:MAG: prepilin-type N-terminal cleavage/methylation domain-containing protein [Candidatus Pacebacteria bacterium]|nr:prepilin-type N-terminal cleavage/methylation domain-containing protein [Candidatus Paceibacterota bacterium]